MERSKDWLDEANGDLEHARNDVEGGFYNWACFSAQQSAEKAIKAVFQRIFVYRKVFVFEINAPKAGLKTASKVRVGQVNVRLAQSGDISKLVGFKTLKRGEVEERFKLGHLCFIAEANGNVVFYLWASLKDRYVNVLERKLAASGHELAKSLCQSFVVCVQAKSTRRNLLKLGVTEFRSQRARRHEDFVFRASAAFNIDRNAAVLDRPSDGLAHHRCRNRCTRHSDQFCVRCTEGKSLEYLIF